MARQRSVSAAISRSERAALRDRRTHRLNIVVERLLRARIGQLVPLLQGGNITVIATEVDEAESPWMMLRGVRVVSNRRQRLIGRPFFPSPTVAGAIRGANNLASILPAPYSV